MDIIVEYLIVYIPVILAILSEVIIAAKIISKITAFFKSTNKAVADLKESPEYKELKDQMKVVLKENAELKEMLRVVLLKLNNEVDNGKETTNKN